MFSEGFMLHKPRHFYRFGAFTLNVSDRVLLHGGRELKLGPTAFDLLLFFVARPGALVSRDELKEAVWRTENIEDNNVDQKITEIKRALVPYDRAASEYIQNVRGHGWRFVAQVTEHCETRLPEEEAPLRLSRFPCPCHPRRRKLRPAALSPGAGSGSCYSRPPQLC